MALLALVALGVLSKARFTILKISNLSTCTAVSMSGYVWSVLSMRATVAPIRISQPWVEYQNTRRSICTRRSFQQGDKLKTTITVVDLLYFRQNKINKHSTRFESSRSKAVQILSKRMNQNKMRSIEQMKPSTNTKKYNTKCLPNCRSRPTYLTCASRLGYGLNDVERRRSLRRAPRGNPRCGVKIRESPLLANANGGWWK
uniref:Putative secreted protein n=1 Tax=Anopheles darlingi TaxID=43151 RepID=A0A2M4D9L7_ANODA